MKRHISVGCIALLTLTASVVACGEGDNPQATDLPSGDEPPGEDSGSHFDGGTDASDAEPTPEAGVAAPITPRLTRRLPNAINPYGLLFASDGHLYASGATIEDGVQKLAVWRFTDEGELDTSFGTDGVVTHDLAGDESSFDLVEVSPGHFVVQAVSEGKVWVVPLTKDGAGAFSFGSPVMVPFAWADDDLTGWPPEADPPAYSSWAIALDKSTPDTPKIVVFAAGAPAKAETGTQRTDDDRWIARLLADTLAPDPAFNGGEAFTVDVDGAGLPDNARRGIVLADGSIVSAGYTNFGAGLGNHVVLLKLGADGTVDPAFGFGTSTNVPGQTKFNPFLSSGGFAEAYAVVQQPSGRFVTTGYGVSNFDAPSVSVDLVSFGVNPDGLDATFGRLGSFAWQSETDKSAGLGALPFGDRGRDLAVLPDGRTVHVGVYDDHATVYVLDADGNPDASSGVGGRLSYSFPRALFKVTVSPDGKRIAASAQSTPASASDPPASLLVTLDVGD